MLGAYGRSKERNRITKHSNAYITDTSHYPSTFIHAPAAGERYTLAQGSGRDCENLSVLLVEPYRGRGPEPASPKPQAFHSLNPDENRPKGPDAKCNTLARQGTGF